MKMPRLRKTAKPFKIVLMLGLCLMLSACNTTGKKALTWGAVGAGVGATGAAVSGGSAQRGAIFGGGAGAAASTIWR